MRNAPTYPAPFLRSNVSKRVFPYDPILAKRPDMVEFHPPEGEAAFEPKPALQVTVPAPASSTKEPAGVDPLIAPPSEPAKKPKAKPRGKKHEEAPPPPPPVSEETALDDLDLNLDDVPGE